MQNALEESRPETEPDQREKVEFTRNKSKKTSKPKIKDAGTMTRSEKMKVSKNILESLVQNFSNPKEQYKADIIQKFLFHLNTFLEEETEQQTNSYALSFRGRSRGL